MLRSDGWVTVTQRKTDRSAWLFRVDRSVWYGQTMTTGHDLAAQNSPSAHERILDAATRLFSEHGVRAVGVARVTMDRARNLQVSITVALAGLALLATIAVGGIGRRLRNLVAEAERRRREALRARREMEAVLEATADGVLGVDLDGRCATLNATGVRLLGVTESEAVGRDVHELIHGNAPVGEGHTPDLCPVLFALREGASGEELEDVVWHRSGRSGTRESGAGRSRWTSIRLARRGSGSPRLDSARRRT